MAETLEGEEIMVQPSLSTKRLSLRPFRLADSKEVQRIAGDVRIAMTTLSVPHPYPEGLAEQWISTHAKRYAEGNDANFAIELKSTAALVGCISVSVSKLHRRGEIGYWIGCDYWNQGYCTEALVELIRFSFLEMMLNKVVARHMEKNPPSGKVMIKAGMKQEGLLKDDTFRNGQFENSVLYGLTRKDWELGLRSSRITT